VTRGDAHELPLESRWGSLLMFQCVRQWQK
jgi:hypothetical protein